MMRQRLLTGSVVAILAVWSPMVRADPVAEAQALFDAAKKLGDAGKWRHACPKFQRSLELDEQLGVLLNVANCYEKLGQVATAHARWNDAAELARRDGDERLSYIEGRRQAIAAEVPKLSLEVSKARPGIIVKRDGQEVKEASFGIAVPVDPGEVVVSVWRGEQLLESETIQVARRQLRRLTLDLDAIARRHPPPAPTTGPTTGPTTAPSKGAANPDAGSDGSQQRTIGLVVGGVGAAALLTGVALEVVALVKKGQAEEADACVNKFCSGAGLETAEQAATFAEVGQWVGLGGIATFAVGLTIFLTAPSQPSDGVASEAGSALWSRPGAPGADAGWTLGAHF